MFFIFGIFIAIFLEFLLLIKRDKSRADKILAVWLFLICIHQLLFYLTSIDELYQYPHLLGIELPMPILHGVLLYFYVVEITGNAIKNKWGILLHLLPTLSLIILAIPFYILTGEEKIFIFQNEGAGFEWYMLYKDIAIPLSGLIYSIWSLLLINRYHLKIQNSFSNTDKKELRWLRFLSIGYGIIWILAIFFDGPIIFTGVVVLVLFIGFFGINQLNIFNTPIAEVIENTDFSSPSIESKVKKTRAIFKRYTKSGLTEEMGSQIYSKLNDFMEGNELYKNEDLTLTELAKFLDAHPNHLSQVINEREGKNFYNYINSIRIKAFIKLASLPENKKYTMISLAYDCGFGTKSTFNKHFKATTGKTPTKFFNADH